MRLDIADLSSSALRMRSAPLPFAGLRTRAGTLTLILALSFTVRILWIAISQWQPTPDDDAYRYDMAARSLAGGLGYIHLTGDPTAFWPPGYSLLLAGGYLLFGQHIEVAQTINALLGTATVGLVYLIGLRLFGTRPALIAAAITALFPSLIFFTAVTTSEVAFTFFALLGVLMLIIEAQSLRDGRRDLRWLLAAGAVLGFASLIRGQALLLPLVLIPFWWRCRIDRSGIADGVVALALGMALIVAPWSIRNSIEMRAPVLISTNAGIDFWIGHHESARGDYGPTGGDELVFSHPELDSVGREVRANNEGFRKGVTYALSHPREELALPFKKLFWLYYNDEEGLRWNEGHGGQEFLSAPTRDFLLTLSNVYYFTIAGVLLLGVPLWFSLRDPGRLLLISLVLYWTAVHLVFFGDPRFHAPMMPIAALLAALPLAALRFGLPEEAVPEEPFEAQPAV
ncbi:MAG: glycosyltransferase family 39 protein [Dehalococcoidia bacterium]